MGNHEVGQILVVSASTSEIAQIKESLRPFHVVSVSNGQEAHSLLLTDRDFHVVIIDLAIEESQWRALLRTITVNPQYSHLCSIVLSEENKAALEVEALCLGATDYIRKPYTLQKFYERVFLHF